MKRFIALVLVVFLLAVPVMAEEIDVIATDMDRTLALLEQIDLSVLDTEHLLSTLERINVELTTRDTDERSLIYPGVYIGGDSIRPGSYIITCVDVYDLYLSVFVYPPEDETKDPEKPRDKYNDALYVGEKFFVRIEEGTKLSIAKGIGSLSSSDSSWAP